MKYLFTLISILGIQFIQAQTSVYKPFPVNYGNWVYRFFGDMGEPTEFYRQYTLSGDTVISGINYKKMTISGDLSFSYYAGGIRENNKIIYFIPDTSATEFILYDFNISVGDTFVYSQAGDYCELDTIIPFQEDSILIGADYHRLLSIDPGWWIEGIGNWHLLLHPTEVNCSSGMYRLECMVSDSNFIYPDDYASCSFYQ